MYVLCMFVYVHACVIACVRACMAYKCVYRVHACTRYTSTITTFAGSCSLALPAIHVSAVGRHSDLSSGKAPCL